MFGARTRSIGDGKSERCWAKDSGNMLSEPSHYYLQDLSPRPRLAEEVRASDDDYVQDNKALDELEKNMKFEDLPSEYVKSSVDEQPVKNEEVMSYAELRKKLDEAKAGEKTTEAEEAKTAVQKGRPVAIGFSKIILRKLQINFVKL